ncbi:MAG TPA: S9 family peptidase [Chthoniobacterales bacterium]|nr:S9 family peptidase [Chthoniobacterales bacterium]
MLPFFRKLQNGQPNGPIYRVQDVTYVNGKLATKDGTILNPPRPRQLRCRKRNSLEEPPVEPTPRPFTALTLNSCMQYIRFLVALALALPLAPLASAETPAPSELEREVTLMGKIGACWSPSFSPDGAKLAFISNISGVPQVYVMPTAAGFPEQITALDDPIDEVNWSPTGEFLAFNVAPAGGLNTQIYVIKPDGTGMRLLTLGGDDNNYLNGWSDDGRILAISSNRRNPATTDSYFVDVASGELRMIAENKGVGGVNDVSRDNRFAVIARVLNRGNNDLFVVDTKSGAEALFTPHEGPGAFGSASFTPDGRAIYFTSNKDRDMLAFARVRLDEQGRPGAIETIASRDDAEAESLVMNRQGTTLALLWNVAGKSELAFHDLKSGKTTPGPQLPAEIVTQIDFSLDGGRLAMVAAGANAPRDIHVLDIKAKRFTQVTHSPHAGVDLATMVRPELVRYKAHDGLELSGWLYRPKNVTAPAPIVLNFHGGPEGQERPGFNATYQALLARGIAVLGPNVRGSSGFGKRFVNLDNGALREEGVRDIKATVDHVIGAKIADPQRIGIMGGSYGGYMVMAGLTDYPDLFAAGANLFGVVNFETFFKNTQPWMAAISKIEYGNPDTEAEMLKKLSPIHRVDRVRAPTIVLHGANDTNVPVIEAEQVVESLKSRNVPVEYVFFPDEGHGWRKTPNRIRSTVRIVSWFDKYLNQPRTAMAR